MPVPILAPRAISFAAREDGKLYSVDLLSGAIEGSGAGLAQSAATSGTGSVVGEPVEIDGNGALLSQSAATVGTGSVSGEAGDNETRILAILDGREPHFTPSYPADPVTTREVTVTTASGFNTEAAVAGTRIIISASFSGSIQITADDIDVLMSNSATITGSLTLGPSSYVNRIRWTGGNFAGRFIGPRYRDALFDDVHFHVSSGPDYFHYIAVGNRIDRFAFLNSTFEVSGTFGSGDNWAMFVLSRSISDPHTDMFFLNSKSISTGLHTHRIMTVRNIIYADSAFNPDGASTGAGLRLHLGCENVWIKDSWVRGRMHINNVNSGDPAHVLNARFDALDMYMPADFGYLLDSPTSTPNTGEVRNSTFHHYAGAGSGTFSLAELTYGSGNSRVAWDASTVPDYSIIGAVR
jgi:hypothetical protein